jgi:hypothetical protein
MFKDQNSLWLQPQFIFGIILVMAWIILVYITLQTPSLTQEDRLNGAERISALFGTALGFVWGHYFGKEGATAGVEAGTQGAKQAISSDLEKEQAKIREFAEGMPT